MPTKTKINLVKVKKIEETSNFIYNFQQVSTIRSFADNICECKMQ